MPPDQPDDYGIWDGPRRIPRAAIAIGCIVAGAWIIGAAAFCRWQGWW